MLRNYGLDSLKVEKSLFCTLYQHSYFHTSTRTCGMFGCEGGSQLGWRAPWIGRSLGEVVKTDRAAYLSISTAGTAGVPMRSVAQPAATCLPH